MEKENIKSKIIKYGIIGVFFIIILTLIFNFIMTRKSIITVAHKNYWIGYYGSIVGGLISGGITFIGVWFTISFYTKQDNDRRLLERKQERLKIRPYIRGKVNKDIEDIDVDTILHFIDETKDTKMDDFVLELENIGHGPAVDIEFINLSTVNYKIQTGHMSLNENEKRGVLIMYELEEKEVLQLVVNYKDLYHNIYKQSILIENFKVEDKLHKDIIGSDKPELL